jgi:quercetin 2,3-dioxygenase
MIEIRKSKERGYADHGWLKSHHTFSFADYYDEKFMSFRHLRVINEDYVDGGMGFGTHPHNNMEIITYVLAGELEHKDSMGTGSVMHYGEVQVMSAGTGVTHSEFNHSKKDRVHLLQIWILPDQKGLKPNYQQKNFSEKDKKNKLCLLASKDGRNDSLMIHQDVDLYSSILDSKKKLEFPLRPNRFGWIQVAKGSVKVNGQKLEAGDGAAVSKEKSLSFEANEKAEFLLFDLV